MTGTSTFRNHTRQTAGATEVSPEDRTKVILMSQVVAIVALLILWSIIRAKRATRTEA